ncbi:MAG: OmpA family protein [Pseudomonadota bacterium]
MRYSKVTGAVLVAGMLAGCSDYAQTGTPVPAGENTQRGAGIGAAAGALLGAIVNDDNRAAGAITGAVVGGAIGAGVGYNLDRQEADLRAQLQDDRVTITNTGDRLIVTFPQDITFASGSFDVRSELRPDLLSLARNLQQYPESTVQIVGHTDSDGAADFNQTLSERRANAVADVLINGGVPFQRIQTFGRGEAQPIASNLSPEGKAQNRRVEIVILPNA